MEERKGRRRPATTHGGGSGSDSGGSRPSTIPVRLRWVWFRFADRVLGQQVRVGCIPQSCFGFGLGLTGGMTMETMVVMVTNDDSSAVPRRRHLGIELKFPVGVRACSCSGHISPSSTSVWFELRWTSC
ncbi:hypothetical protein Hanom_Chr14g01259501 [Helianthus anomalus]